MPREKDKMNPPDRSAGAILLVEDDRLLCWSIRKFLENHGFSVDVAADGAEGLRKADLGAPVS